MAAVLAAQAPAASAATSPTTTSTSPATSSLVLGNADSDNATVTGNTTNGAPTGSVSFYVCGPSATPASCTSKSTQVGSAVTLNTGSGASSTAGSSSFVPTATGWWCFAGYYSGSTKYSASSDTTTDECVDVTPIVTTSPTTPASLSLVLGNTNTDRVTVSGNAAGGTPTGNESFYVCGPLASASGCTSQSEQVGSAVSLTAGSGDTAGATSAAFTPTSVGWWCFGGYYSGNSNYSASSDTSSDECFQVTPAPSATVTAPGSPSVVLGGSDSDSFTVTGIALGGSPTGHATFYVCGPTTSPVGCTSTSHPVGAAVSLTAGANDTATATSASFTPSATGWWCFAGDYSGSTTYLSSSDVSTDECFQVTQAASGGSTGPAHSSITLGNADTDTFVATGNSAGGSPTGTVSFYVCGPLSSPSDCTSLVNPFGNPVTLVAGSSDTSSATSVSFTPTSVGYWCFAGYYSGDTNYDSSSDTSTDECFDVTQAPTTTATSPAESSITLGNATTDNATVTGNSVGGSPTGTVAFYVCGPLAAPADCTSQGSPFGNPVTLVPGAGDTATATSLSFTPTAVGYWCFGGDYSGSTSYFASADTSTDECFDVTVAPTTTTTTPYAGTITLGLTETDSATVTGNSVGGSPTGTVAFYVCGPLAGPQSCTSTTDNSLGNPVVLTAAADDTSTATSPSFTPGATGWWCFAGDYSGSTSYLSSSDATTDECFQVIVAQSTTATQPSASAITLGLTETDTATVTGNSVGGSPTGTVTFSECGPLSTPTPCTSGTTFGNPVALTAAANDTSTATSSSFVATSVGWWCFGGTYSGSDSYTASADTSTDECFDVNVAPTTTATSPAAGTITLGNADTDTATVAGNSVGGAPTGTVAFYLCGPLASPASCVSQSNPFGNPVTLGSGSQDAAIKTIHRHVRSTGKSPKRHSRSKKKADDEVDAPSATATSPSFTPTTTGYWCFAGYYSGSTSYLASSDTSTDECIDVIVAPSTTSTAPTQGVIDLGGADTDTATVTGNAVGGSPTGEVDFYSCGPSSSPESCTSTDNELGDGPVALVPGEDDQSTATSISLTPTSTGWWCFAGYYDGSPSYTTSSDTGTDECVDVMVAPSTTSSTPDTSSVILGDTDTDTATVTGNDVGQSPTGTVSFYACGPLSAPASCTSQDISVGGPAPLSWGENDTATATSEAFTPTAVGYWCFGADYSGDTSYATSSDTSSDECFDVTPVQSTSVSVPASSSIVLGDSNFDQLTVSGDPAGQTPGGTVTYYACGPTASPSGCSSQANQVGQPVDLVPGASDTASAFSGAFTPTAAGYWCFGAYYSGDTNYLASSDTDADECFEVLPAPSTTSTQPTEPYLVLGDTGFDSATVTGNSAGGSPTGTVTFYDCGPTRTPVACTTQTHQVGAPITVQAGPDDTATATSQAMRPTGTGYWCFGGYYSGDGNYQVSSDNSTDECYFVLNAPTHVADSPSAAVVDLGSTGTVTATVSGNNAGGSPTGTVTFYVCGPTASATGCTSQTNQLGNAVDLAAGASDTASATTAPVIPDEAGFYCVAGYYSGDGNYFNSSDTSTAGCFEAASGDQVSSRVKVLHTSDGKMERDTAYVHGQRIDGLPTGTVTFYECPSVAGSEGCASTQYQVGSPVELTKKTKTEAWARSAVYAPSQPGPFCFGAFYSGNSAYAPQWGTPAMECVRR